VAVTAEWLVESIDGLTSSRLIIKEFVGIILLPIAGNAAGTDFFNSPGILLGNSRGYPFI
jgi:Ca2+:H+ antiporter